jgi:hypothetical protein
MGLFNKMKEQVFLKESSDAEVQLEKLKALEPLDENNRVLLCHRTDMDLWNLPVPMHIERIKDFYSNNEKIVLKGYYSSDSLGI